jgi:hypothetical protein
MSRLPAPSRNAGGKVCLFRQLVVERKCGKISERLLCGSDSFVFHSAEIGGNRTTIRHNQVRKPTASSSLALLVRRKIGAHRLARA